MYIGLGLFLMVIGAILSFAVNGNIAGINLTMVGYIFMAVGVLAIVLTFVLRRNSGMRAQHMTRVDPETGSRYDETRVDRDGNWS